MNYKLSTWGLEELKQKEREEQKVFNIYDFFRSKELVEELEKANWKFSDLEMIKLIYQSKKPIDLKLEGLKYIAENTSDEEISDLAYKVIYMYNDMIEVMNDSNENTYYKVYSPLSCLEYNPVYRTFDEAIDSFEEVMDPIFYCEDGMVSITRYEYIEEDKEIADLKFIYNSEGDLIDITHTNENYFNYDLDELNDVYIELPIIPKEYELKIVGIYNPDPESEKEYHLLSDNQIKKDQDRKEIISQHTLIGKNRFCGPISVSRVINGDGEIVLANKCINDFVNMYFIDEKITRNDEKLLLLLLIKQMTLNENK